MKTIDQYLRDASGADVIDFRIRATGYTSAPTSFYIHPMGKDGDTLDFTVIGNALVPNGAGGLDFGAAIAAMKQGKRVARAGWNGKGMWLHLIPASHWETTRGLELLDGLPWIGMKTADDKFVPWLASQTDMLAEDWVVVG